MNATLSSEDFLEIAKNLQIHHAIFDRFWSISRPNFTEDIPTAAVYFDKIGETIDFKINPTFWESLSLTQKQFVISHECLHTILYHGLRINNLKNNELSKANMALDIIVNHSLVNNFSFLREEVDSSNKYCWLDTVFKDKLPEPNKYYEYYFNLLKETSPEELNISLELVDSHDGLDSFNTPEFENKMTDGLNSEDLNALSNFIKNQSGDLEDQAKNAGCNPGSTFMQANIAKVKVKRKWETVIKNWASKYIKDRDLEQWSRKNRRFVTLTNDFLLPTEQEVEDYENDKIEVWFFQDTSGSCYHFANRFFAAAKSLPPDRFNVKMHCFDTSVYETDLKSGKLYGFGGTTFSCIENYIKNYIEKHKVAYPKAIFVITDGYGNNVYPVKPQNWYWFIDGSPYLVPKKSHHFNLKEYE